MTTRHRPDSIVGARRPRLPVGSGRLTRAVAVVLAAACSTGMAAGASAARLQDTVSGIPESASDTAFRPPSIIPDDDALHTLPIDPAVRALVDRLGGPSYAERMDAARRIVERDTDPAQLIALLLRDELDAEQRYRVLGVLRELIVQAPRGALGIRMAQVRLAAQAPEGVEIAEVIEGLPAAAVLRVGDVITHIEGVRIRDANELILIIQSRRPGTQVRLDILRTVVDADGDRRTGTLRVNVGLGSTTQLDTPRDPRGAQVAMSPILSRRIIEWNRLVARFQPAARVLRPAAGSPPIFVYTPRTLPEPLIEQHSVIVDLKREIEEVEFGRRSVTQITLAQWRDRLDRLQRESRDPGLQPTERELLMRLAERFEELLALVDPTGR